MWSAFARQFAAYALTRRGKKLFAFAGAMLLVFATTLLIDMQLYASAGFTGVLALAATAAFAVQHVKLRRKQRERLARIAADAIRRVERAKARSETIARRKAAVGGAFRDTAYAVVGAAAGTARFVAGAFAAMAHEAAGAYHDVKRTVGGTAQAVAGGAASLRQAARDARAHGLALLRRASETPRAAPALAGRPLAGPHAIPRIGLRTELN